MKQHTQNRKPFLTLKEIAFFGVYSSLIIAFKELMGVLPSIEPVSVMLIALTCVYGVKALLPAYVFSFVQIFIHGFHIWNFMYLYVWAVLVLITLLIRPVHNFIGVKIIKKASFYQTALWVAVSGVFGLCFGVLCSVPYFITLGYAGAIGWIASGFVMFDIPHCIGNALITAVFFLPLYRILSYSKEKLK